MAAKIGIVGTRRGRTFKSGIEVGGGDVTSVCDVSEEAVVGARAYWGDVACYSDYDQMLD